jgi:hypothetical protein
MFPVLFFPTVNGPVGGGFCPQRAAISVDQVEPASLPPVLPQGDSDQLGKTLLAAGSGVKAKEAFSHRQSAFGEATGAGRKFEMKDRGQVSGVAGLISHARGHTG